ncbi:hypothetical protein [Novosphingobium panipatense]|uniref:hypothetical protein n=1 Tax=Novosphingobium panipatense TaxID=428991 RepID=UPI0036215219
MTAWGSPEEVERRNRIRLSAWAFAYEIEDDPIASDEAFDALAKTINPTATTGHPQLDAFFATEFSPTPACGCGATQTRSACASCANA